MALFYICPDCDVSIEHYAKKIRKIYKEIVNTPNKAEIYKKMGQAFFEVIKNNLLDVVTEKIYTLDDKQTQKAYKKIRE